MRRIFSSLLLIVLITLAGCGGNNNTSNNAGLFGYWNIVMYPNSNNQTPVYVFALAMSQEGSNYSGAYVTYTGGIAAPINMCINPKTLTAQATTTGNNFNMTITDSSTNTVITVSGSLLTTDGSLSGTYSNAASSGCAASQGTIVMSPQ